VEFFINLLCIREREEEREKGREGGREREKQNTIPPAETKMLSLSEFS
jgi:hypothetical protein